MDPVTPNPGRCSEGIRTAAQHLRSLRPVDLAPMLGRGIPRWPTHPHLIIDPTVVHESDGYYCQNLSMPSISAAMSTRLRTQSPTRCTPQSRRLPLTDSWLRTWSTISPIETGNPATSSRRQTLNLMNVSTDLCRLRRDRTGKLRMD